MGCLKTLNCQLQLWIHHQAGKRA